MKVLVRSNVEHLVSHPSHPRGHQRKIRYDQIDQAVDAELVGEGFLRCLGRIGNESTDTG